MLKIIENANSLKQFEKETMNELPLWGNVPVVERIKNMAENLDAHYGANRDIAADLGGYMVILYGEPCEMEKEYSNILKQYSLQQDLYEFEERYQNEQKMVIIRLYLCSSDYAVVVVMVQ